MNFNFIRVWCRDAQGQVYALNEGYQCSMSSLADARPDPSAVMRGDSNNSVAIHSKREECPWWQLELDRPTDVVSLEFHNRKDQHGVRAKAIAFEFISESGKVIARYARCTKATQTQILQQEYQAWHDNVVDALKQAEKYGLAQRFVAEWEAYSQVAEVTQESKTQLIDCLEQCLDVLAIAPRDLGTSASESLDIHIGNPNARFLRVCCFKRRMMRPLELSVDVGGKQPISLSESSVSAHDGQVLAAKQTYWCAQAAHLFELDITELKQHNIKLWAADDYSQEALVQRLVQISEDGKNWHTIETTLDNMLLHHQLMAMYEWVLGPGLSERFAYRVGEIVALYRMAPGRGAKRLLRPNNLPLQPFLDGVCAGGSRSSHLPNVIYTRHGIAVPFSEQDSDFLARRMFEFAEFLKGEFGLKAFPCYGTLLGIHRDGDFLPHDDDIDLAAIVDLPQGMTYLEATEYWAERLRKAGVECRPPTPESLNLHCYFADCDMDLFLVYRHPSKMNKVWTHMQGYKTREVRKDLLEPLGTREFKGHTFYVPAKVEGFLEDRYGEGWVTPDPTYEM
ncbi:LicD family protein [Neiella marina]|uniref:LicD family protein n=1 Tax=Neiella holothuriorum TaxID=2870530 RepID=A0ABS7EEH7_9GAMM|nr:LicD family protein [Neiella holothuriorum]MBW8190743.1 LicD family protein [Neiella holothuriorum]